jgi:hypothetical protein
MLVLLEGQVDKAWEPSNRMMLYLPHNIVSLTSHDFPFHLLLYYIFLPHPLFLMQSELRRMRALHINTACEHNSCHINS